MSRLSSGFLILTFVIACFGASVKVRKDIGGDATVLAREVCYDHYGCFSTESPWTSLLRPHATLPDPPYEVGTRFLLFTRTTLNEDFELVPDNDVILGFSPYQKDKPTIFLIHGFTDSSRSDWMVNAKNALLEKEDVNIIQVDWSPGADGTYLKATANARMVGAQLTRLARFLVEKANLDLSNTRIIAHSIGAHAAGYAGEALGGIVGHITALDPAEPYFGGTDKIIRLDETDAQQVHVIHTNGDSLFGLGIKAPIGHVDIFPNGGITQPGCKDALGNLVGSILDLLFLDFEGAIGQWACSHVRATEFYVESITSPCPFVAFSCNSYGDYNDGKCTTSCTADGACSVLGYGSQGISNARGSYFLNTDKDSSYCVQNVKFDASVSQIQEKTNGEVTVQFRRQDGTVSSKFSVVDGTITSGLILNKWLEVSSKILLSSDERPSLILHYKRGGLLPIGEPKYLSLDGINLYVVKEDLSLETLRYPGVTLEAGVDLIVTSTK